MSFARTKRGILQDRVEKLHISLYSLYNIGPQQIMSGNLIDNLSKYDLNILTLPTVIGSPVTFEIVPATPGIIFASLQSCTVSKDELSYNVLDNRSSGVCRDWATEFQKITSTDTWASMERQEFDFLAFKWDTSSVNVSNTMISSMF